MNYFILTMATLLGAGIGSFLAMAAYRLPRGLSFVKPERSFCPGCERMIPWYRNLPVLTWLLQRGRCFCPLRQKVSPHYVLLEITCAALFALNVYVARGNLVELVCLSIFGAYALLASAIDLEHQIIPTTLSVPVALIGLISSCGNGTPGFAAGSSLTERVLMSLGGAATGAAAVAGLMLIGKLFFRPQPQLFDPPIEVKITARTVRSRQGAGAWEEAPLTDYLLTPWERMELHSASRIETITLRRATPQYRYHAYAVDRIVMPRDAIGLGDLKWLGALGAWVGPLGAIETLGLASILACFGIVFLIIKNRQKPSGMPFGPWLSLAAYLLLLVHH
jgi:leader peptidase (prepilin peptidase) / N-methyltransferase